MEIDKIILSVVALISTIVTSWKIIKEERRKDKNNVSKNLLKQANTSSEIVNRMEKLREKLGADRIQIIDFHNGKHYASGKSATKFSCTYEVVREGVDSKQKLIQDILIDFVPRYIEDIITKKVLEYTDMKKFAEDYVHAIQLKEILEVKSFYIRVIRNNKKDPIGYISIQYTQKPHEPMSQDQKDDINKLKYYLEDVLNERR
jgi:hypothetical protein